MRVKYYMVHLHWPMLYNMVSQWYTIGVLSYALITCVGHGGSIGKCCWFSTSVFFLYIF